MCVCVCVCGKGWVDQDEVTLIPDMVRVQLSTAVGLFGSSEQEWTDLMSMFARAVRHVHFYQISACPGTLPYNNNVSM